MVLSLALLRTERTVNDVLFRHLLVLIFIEIINIKARHNLIDAKCRWRSNQLYGSVNFREALGQTQVMQIHQGETLNHQGRG